MSLRLSVNFFYHIYTFKGVGGDVKSQVNIRVGNQTPYDVISLNIITDMYNYNLDNYIEKYNRILTILLLFAKPY